MTFNGNTSTPGSPRLAPDQRISIAVLIAGVAAGTLAAFSFALLTGALAARTSLYMLDLVQATILSALVVALYRVVRAVGRDDLAAMAWRVLFAGASLYLGGEITLFGVRLVGGTGEVPLPSPADPLFVSGQVLIVLALTLH